MASLAGATEQKAQSSSSSGNPAAGRTRICVAGYAPGSSAFARAANVAAALEHLFPTSIQAAIVRCKDKSAFKEWLGDGAEWAKTRGLSGDERAESHRACPLCWAENPDGSSEYIGDASDLFDYSRRNYMASGGVRSLSGGMVGDEMDLEASAQYDYDLVCIGGGSGGLACAKEAAKLIKEARQSGDGNSGDDEDPGPPRVAVLDYVKPSGHGTTWKLGGTCVNVGCIPKKLYHRAANLGEAIKHDAKEFGWGGALKDGSGEGAVHDWATLTQNVRDHIGQLNYNYRVSLSERNVKYLPRLGRMVDAHTIECTNRRGQVKTITAARVVVAVGGRPATLPCPGGELAIDSDDMFQMDWSKHPSGPKPGKTLVVGASYVALECAGFLTALGFDVTVMVRSILLRGFDREMAENIGEYMEATGTSFLYGSTPTKLTRDEGSGKITVEFTRKDKSSGEVTQDKATYDTVFSAIGRRADTTKLGLDTCGKEGVKVSAKNGKIICTNEQTTCPNIYAIGDVVEGVQELTPVAIQSGRLLARRLFGGSSQLMDYDLVPTAVFTPIEYGACGLSEEEAYARYGQDDVEVYHTKHEPLEWELSEDRPHGFAKVKLVCLKSEGLRVVGLHVLGPHCGEITQGFAVAMRKGATYDDFCDTVGIHPTFAENFTTLTVTKASGEDAGGDGC